MAMEDQEGTILGTSGSEIFQTSVSLTDREKKPGKVVISVPV